MEKRHREVKQKTIGERKLETSVVAFAERQGMLAPKFSPMGSSGWPDRIFLYKGVAMFLEFKRPGEPLKKLQALRAKDLNDHMFLCLKCDDLEQGRRYIELFKMRVDKEISP